MSYVTCPCGFRFEGDVEEVTEAFDAHGCEHHKARPSKRRGSSDWAEALVLIVFFVAFATVLITCIGVARG